MDMRGFMFNYGLQVYPSFGKHQITAGFTFESASSFDADYNSIKDQRFGSTQDGRYIFSQTVEETDSIIDITLPSQFSLGLSYMYDQKLLISAEYQTRDWSNYKILQESNEFKQSHSMGFGLQYTPNPQTLRRGSVGSYLARVNFRAGYKTRDMYLTYNGKQLSSNLFSFGLGLPYGNTKTTFNITYQYGRMGLKNSGLLDEEFHTIALGLSLYDIWFYKSKFD
jgi:long-subunit fatty acid transport protein